MSRSKLLLIGILADGVAEGLKAKQALGFKEEKKKDRLTIENACLSDKNAATILQAHLKSQLSKNKYIVLNFLIELLQSQNT